MSDSKDKNNYADSAGKIQKNASEAIEFVRHPKKYGSTLSYSEKGYPKNNGSRKPTTIYKNLLDEVYEIAVSLKKDGKEVNGKPYNAFSETKEQFVALKSLKGNSPLKSEAKKAMSSKYIQRVLDLLETEDQRKDFLLKELRIFFIPFGLYGTVRNIAQQVIVMSPLDKKAKKRAYTKLKNYLVESVLTSLRSATTDHKRKSTTVLSVIDLFSNRELMTEDEFNDGVEVHVPFDGDTFMFKPVSEPYENQVILKKIREAEYIPRVVTYLSKFYRNTTSEGFAKFFSEVCRPTILREYFTLFDVVTTKSFVKGIPLNAMIVLGTACGATTGYSFNNVPKDSRIARDPEDSDSIDTFTFVQNTFDLVKVKNSNKYLSRLYDDSLFEKQNRMVNRFLEYAMMIPVKCLTDISSSASSKKEVQLQSKIHSYLRKQLGIDKNGDNTKTRLKALKTDKSALSGFDELFVESKSARRFILVDKFEMKDNSSCKGFSISSKNSDSKSSKVIPLFPDTVKLNSDQRKTLEDLLREEFNSFTMAENKTLVAHALRYCLAVPSSYFSKSTKTDTNEAGKKVKRTIKTEDKKAMIVVIVNTLFQTILGVEASSVGFDVEALKIPSGSKRKHEEDIESEEEEEEEEDEEEEEEEE